MVKIFKKSCRVKNFTNTPFKKSLLVPQILQHEKKKETVKKSFRESSKPITMQKEQELDGIYPIVWKNLQ